MGAESSVQRDGKSQEDAPAPASASAGELSAEVRVLQEGGSVLDSKPLEKNGQISSMTSLNGPSEDNTLAEVGQPDGVSQKEEAPETMDTIQDEVTPQVNGEKVDKESPDANDISAVEEKAAEEKPDDASEVGFKKIFRFVGFKFTLKKDKNEEKDPVTLLTVKDKEGEEVSATDEPGKEVDAATAEEKSTAEEKEADTDVSAAEVTNDTDKSEATAAPSEATAAPSEATAAEATDEAVKEEGAETTPPALEATMSPFRKLFNVVLFSNLRKKGSIKKTKEADKEAEGKEAEDKEAEGKEVEDKEAEVEEETAKTKEAATAVKEKDEEVATEPETKGEASNTAVEEKSEPTKEAPITPEEAKSEAAPESDVAVTPTEATTDETKPEDQKAKASAEEEKVTSEAELQSSQEKVKAQGSPLKKLFTGAGLKKLSTKKQKSKKDGEAKLTESGEQAAEQLQNSTEAVEAPKADSGPPTPEESGENAAAVEVTQNESGQETEGEVSSDGEKKKEGIVAWSSFKKLVTPKKRVKRSSESEDEATGEKPVKSATLSSSESAALADKCVEDEAKEDKPSEEEPKTENTEKLDSSTEEPKKKMDTSVSWEALMCMGGPKKRTRRTSDSDDEETKIEEVEVAAAEGEQEVKTEVVAVAAPSSEDEKEVVPAPEPVVNPPQRVSPWETLKRIVMSKNKPKAEAKAEEPADQTLDNEAPKDESSFSLRKFFPGRRKKKVEKQASADQGSGEEDFDTPAVVPLSEYDEQVEAEVAPPAEPPQIQIKVTAEDRSPSWIPAIVVDDDKPDQLSDIPEEAENAATPKSVDTDNTEDDIEDLAPPPTFLGRRLSTAEVKPLAPAQAAATTPVPQGPRSDSAEEVVGAIEAQIGEIPTQTSVTVEDVPVEVASEKSEHEPPTDNVEAMTVIILEPHAPDEAMAICTGLGTKEIAKVAVEKPVQPIIECVAVVRDTLSTEVTMEEKPPNMEEGVVTEDEVFMTQVQQVEAIELQPAVEDLVTEVPDIQAASEGNEPEIEIIGVVTTLIEESEVIHPAVISEYSPSTEATEPAIPAVACEEVPVVTETVVLVAPPNVGSEVATSDVVVMNNASVSEPVSVEPMQLQKTKEAAAHAAHVETAEATTVLSAESVNSAVVEQASKKTEEIKEEVEQVSEIEVQSMVIAQAVIQEAVDKVSEKAPEPEKPTKRSATIPTPVHAVPTTEKEVEVATEAPVITDTPVPVDCKKPEIKALCVAMEVTDATPIEITESLTEEEKKPQQDVKIAEEVKASEETIVMEEVVEMKAESQTEEEPEQIEEEQSKQDQEPEVKEAAADVEAQSEEIKPDAEKEKVLEIHMPVQVVLQMAQEVDEPSVEEEAEELDSSGPVAKDTSETSGSRAAYNKLPVLSEEPDSADAAPSQDTDAAASQPETTSSGKCAEVMAQVIEVIEEAVKEIEPVSTDITAAS